MYVFMFIEKMHWIIGISGPIKKKHTNRKLHYPRVL